MISVIKLGGSLLKTGQLASALAVSATLSGGVVIVPGGGTFADLVRSEQLRWHFDDVAAHRMAIVAMQQMALLCHSLNPAFHVCRCVDEMVGVSDRIVWAPDWSELDAAGVEAGWDTTSDSLAAWLAGYIGADRLFLVKAAAIDQEASLAELQKQGVVDANFLRFASPDRYEITVINNARFLSAS